MSILYDMRSGELVKSKLFSNGLLLKDALGFSPLTLFADGSKQGVWYDPSDKSTLFQDVAGTVPVTKDGDPVALMRDKSGNGNHALAPTSAARPIYKTDGILHWFKQDGTDDYMKTADFGLTQPVSIAFAMSTTKSPAAFIDGLINNSGSIIANGRALRLYSGSGDASYYSPLITNNQNHIYDARLSGSNSYVTFDNNPITIRPTGTTAMSGITIGALGNNSAHNDGRFYGTVVVAADLNAADRQAVKQYLAAKAGVTL